MGKTRTQGTSYHDKMANAYFRIIEEPSIIHPVKWFCLLQLLHDEMISLHKAFEMAQENGLLLSSYAELDARVTYLWEKYYKRTD